MLIFFKVLGKFEDFNFFWIIRINLTEPHKPLSNLIYSTLLNQTKSNKLGLKLCQAQVSVNFEVGVIVGVDLS